MLASLHIWNPDPSYKYSISFIFVSQQEHKLRNSIQMYKCTKQFTPFWLDVWAKIKLQKLGTYSKDNWILPHLFVLQLFIILFFFFVTNLSKFVWKRNKENPLFLKDFLTFCPKYLCSFPNRLFYMHWQPQKYFNLLCLKNN